MRLAILGLMLLGLGGCSTQQEEDSKWVGLSEGRYVDPTTNRFDDRYTRSPASTSCLTTGQTFELRLQSFVVGWEFDGTLEKLTSNPGNELGVFITVNKSRPGTGAVVAAPAPPVAQPPAVAKPAVQPPVAAKPVAPAAPAPAAPAVAAVVPVAAPAVVPLAVSPPVIAQAQEATKATPVQGGTQTNPVERRLVYVTDSTLPRTDMNGANLLVYSDTYDGSDYTISFEVVEFDADGFDQFAGIARELAKAAQESGISANLPYSALLTKVGTAMFNSIKRNDKVAFYKTSLLPCDSVVGDQKSVFLKAGEFGVVRVPQENHIVDWSDLAFEPNTNRVKFPDSRADSISYMLFSIYRRK